METINFEQLLLKTAFCCMSSDGNIDKREIVSIEALCQKSDMFNDFNFNTAINRLVSEINTNGRQFIQEYLDLLANSKLLEREEISVIAFALKAIYADEQMEYSEVKFFKNIRHHLSLSNEKIVETFKNEYPEIEDFLEEDIRTDISIDALTKEFFEISDIPKFENITIPKNI